MNDQSDLAQPRTPLQYFRLYLTGFAMGGADIVPGVSGGTMAFILGVYETLVNAIKSFDLSALRLAARFEFREVIEYVPFRFLVALGLGIASAVLALSNVLHYLLENEPTYLFAFFGGLIIASILAIGIKVTWSAKSAASMLLGAAAAFIIVGLPAISNAGHSPLVLFLSGAVAICAMILPGISGSFILLILGQYEHVIAAVKSYDVLTVLPVGFGAGIGIIAFSRILSWLLKHYENMTIAALVGVMLGSLRKIWMEAEAGVNTISDSGQLTAGQVGLVIGLLLVGFLLVSLLDHLQSRTNPVFAWVWRPRPAVDVVAEKAQALD